MTTKEIEGEQQLPISGAAVYVVDWSAYLLAAPSPTASLTCRLARRRVTVCLFVCLLVRLSVRLSVYLLDGRLVERPGGVATREKTLISQTQGDHESTG